MLRPATPLTIAFFIAFVLLLLSCLSTPIIVDIPLGANNGLNFGVFGYCKTGANGFCSPKKIGYDRSELDLSTQQDFSVGSGTRYTLSYILVVHPIAAFMVLICTCLAGASHFRGPSHSPRFLLGLLIFTFPTLLVTLLAFLVDILLFIPHMQWGGWIVLPATIIVTACGVLTCAMRRTLVGRKARKKRIAENADMNGSEYYAMKAEAVMRSTPLQEETREEPEYARAESPPPLPETSGASGLGPYEKSAQFSNFSSRPSMDDRTPLNGREPSIRTMSTTGNGSRGNAGGMPLTGSALAGSALAYGNEQMEPVSPLDGSYRSPGGYRGRGGPVPPYGRGGPPPQPYGRGRGYGPRGPPNGSAYPARGNFRGGPPRGRGPFGAGWNQRGRGGPSSRGRPLPPPDYGYGRSPDMNDPYEQQQQVDYDELGRPLPPIQPPYSDHDGYHDQPSPNMGPGSPVEYDQQYSGAYEPRRKSPGGSNRRTSQTRDPASFGFSGRMPSPSPSRSQIITPRAESPPPPLPGIPGQAVELDHRTGSPSSPMAQHMPVSMDELGSRSLHDEHDMAGPYVPTSSWRHSNQSNSAVDHGYAAAELPAHDQQMPSHQHTTSEVITYYEDVDPRFADPVPMNPSQHNTPTMDQAGPLPSALIPGYGAAQNRELLLAQDRGDTHSPAHSDNSNFTSISQRGINPDWQPPPGLLGPRGPGPRSMAPRSSQRNEEILASNPDFMLPGAPGLKSSHNRQMNSSGSHRYPGPA